MRTKTVFRRLASALLAVTMAGAAYAIDAPLQFVRHQDRDREFHPSGSAMINSESAPPSGVWRLPDLKDQHPRYAIAKLGDQEFLMILAREKNNDPFYNRLYFDVNHDRDLTNDASVQSDRNSEDSGYASFPSVDVSIKVGQTSLPYSFRVVVYGGVRFSGGKAEADSSRFLMIRLMPSCSYACEFTTDGYTYHAILGDTDGNGRFGDKPAKETRKSGIESRPFTSGDSFYYYSNDKPDYYMGQMFCDFLSVGDKLYTVAMAADYRMLTLEPVAGPLATLKLPQTVERMQLCADDGKQSIVLYRPGANAQIPPGSYRLLSYQILRKDDQGDNWRLNAEGTNKSAIETFTTGAQHTLTYGEPFKPSVKMQQSGGRRNNEPVSLAFTIVGAGDERVTDLARVSGHATKIAMSKKIDSRPKEPTYRIVTPDNEVVTSGSFEYG